MDLAHNQRPPTTLTQQARLHLEDIKNNRYSVLVGRNNSGKSYLLKSLVEGLGQNAAYIGPARYQNFNHLPFFNPGQNKKQQWWQRFSRWRTEQQNQDNSPVNLQQAIADFSDEKRDQLFLIMKELLGVEFEISRSVPDNEMSQRFVKCGGHNLSFTSSGVRLIASIVTSLLDEDFSKVVIDEPELGISPEAQGILSEFLFDREKREEYFPHLSTIVFATHSTVFLDRQDISNNYIVAKDGDEINISKVESQSDFNRVHFFLLGNRFETLYLPSAIFVVEGKTDHAFIRRVIEIEFPNSLVSVIPAHSDDRVKQVVHMAGQVFGDIQKSPYQERIFPVLDAVHGANLVPKIEASGIPKENVIVWNANGIEHYYPSRILREVFGGDGDIAIDGDTVSGPSGVSYSKNVLGEMVCSKLKIGEEYAEEFREKLIDRLNALL